MERVGILVNKLKEQLDQQLEPHKMLVTAQMLYTELMQETQNGNTRNSSKVAVVGPGNPPLFQQQSQPLEVKHEEPVVEAEKPVIEHETVTDTPFAFSGPATEERVADVASSFVYESSSEVKATAANLTIADIPTLAQQKIVYELNDEIGNQESLNEKLKEEKIELAALLHNVPIQDLKKAISINDRHQFIESLFRGDETMYERSIKTINNFRIFAEAEFWIQRELKLKLGWDTNSAEVKLFDHLVRRRFS